MAMKDVPQQDCPGAPKNPGSGQESRTQQSSGCRGSVQVPVRCIRKGQTRDWEF